MEEQEFSAEILEMARRGLNRLPITKIDFSKWEPIKLEGGRSARLVEAILEEREEAYRDPNNFR